jgi:hypothetical protein
LPPFLVVETKNQTYKTPNMKAIVERNLSSNQEESTDNNDYSNHKLSSDFPPISPLVSLASLASLAQLVDRCISNPLIRSYSDVSVSSDKGAHFVPFGRGHADIASKNAHASNSNLDLNKTGPIAESPVFVQSKVEVNNDTFNVEAAEYNPNFGAPDPEINVAPRNNEEAFIGAELLQALPIEMTALADAGPVLQAIEPLGALQQPLMMMPAIELIQADVYRHEMQQETQYIEPYQNGDIPIVVDVVVVVDVDQFVVQPCTLEVVNGPFCTNGYYVDIIYEN